MNPTRRMAVAIFVMAPLLLCAVTMPAMAQTADAGNRLDDFLRVFTFQDYNTRVVVVGTTLLGLAAGLIGTFLVLLRRALLSDTLSHATLPGIALAFMVMTLITGNGKHLPGLIAGAAVFAVIGTLSVLAIQRFSRLKDDAALGIVLSVYFGLGIALMGMATRMDAGNAAGLSSFIYGKTASMLFSDALLIAVTAFVAALACLLFFKEFSLICFDADYGRTQGWPVTRLDFLMMALVVLVTVIGLQAVGLILVVALLIIPAASARFWTHRLRTLLWLSGLFGALSGFLGSGISALMANLPAGAVIVLAASFFFLVSLFFGSARGLLRLGIDRQRLQRKIMNENLLRDLHEWDETAANNEKQAPRAGILMRRRAWTSPSLKRTLRRLNRQGLIRQPSDGTIRLTDTGREAAQEIVRRHRLWETYLITHADVAPGMVDLSADRIEHVLEPELISRLETLLDAGKGHAPPPSPHKLPLIKGVR
ncbi:iron chelate uptake ABC transporter family permease subunit [Desulfosarcina ovata]|uniref:Manganese ABC transporter permease n=1 Tax=Desulfosarcina ovata subsp. ovata TaxID=2752305 RepID=A0A5K8ADG5_9BACT|nr:iron chelate uptake ABC transporter family permease subunit [Desulfosarcina ovata]BBO90611.1 manganese ABC transporter permease [Desulfosarcina ovata subsp. ovata]